MGKTESERVMQPAAAQGAELPTAEELDVQAFGRQTRRQQARRETLTKTELHDVLALHVGSRPMI